MIALRICADQEGEANIFQQRQQTRAPHWRALASGRQVGAVHGAWITKSHRRDRDIPLVVKGDAVELQPIAQSISRRVVPRHPAFMHTPARRLTSDQYARARIDPDHRTVRVRQGTNATRFNFSNEVSEIPRHDAAFYGAAARRPSARRRNDLDKTAASAHPGGMRIRWFWLVGGALALVSFGLVGCAASRLPNVTLDPALAPAAPPPVLGPFGDDGPVTTIAEWEARRAPALRQALAERIFGPYPTDVSPARVLSRDDISYTPLAAHAGIEQWSVAVGDEDRPLHFNMVVVRPIDANGPLPVIIMQNFCGNRAAFRDVPDAIAGPLTPSFSGCEENWTTPLVELIFGRHIMVPPYEQILSRGYAIALFYAGDVVGDEAASAREGLTRLYGAGSADAGAIAVWAWLYSQAYDALAADSRFDPARIAIWGHSRNGKSALLAGANDARIAAVISHQSGRGGAALNRSETGESISEMMSAYSWWFPPAYAAATETPEVDQHQLIALIAPRPVFLGNARRDAWADPLGAWRAAEAASPVYELYGARGLDQTDLREPNNGAGIAFYTRGGLHGVHSQDWDAFLDFLDAHFQSARQPIR